MGIAGLFMLVIGLILLIESRLARKFRVACYGSVLIVTPMHGRPREIYPQNIVSLKADHNNVGGVRLIGPNRRALLGATRMMMGYEKLIWWLRQTRPDLAVPPQAEPLT
jgi:hypothetical protein